MYLIVHGNAPYYIISMANDQHLFFIRNSILSVALPHVKLSGKKTFRLSAGEIWNERQVSLRSAEDLLLFKKEVNKHLREELITEDRSDFYFYESCFIIIQPYKYPV